MSEAISCIVACIDPASDGQALQQAAVSQAREFSARVIFYDVSHDGQMTDSRPNEWAGEGEKERYDRPLDPVAIETLGFHDLALVVKRARDAGVDAFGWLPNETGGKGLASFAQRERADLVLLAAGTETTARYVEDLRGASESDGVVSSNIKLVDEDAGLVELS